VAQRKRPANGWPIVPPSTDSVIAALAPALAWRQKAPAQARFLQRNRAAGLARPVFCAQTGPAMTEPAPRPPSETLDLVLRLALLGALILAAIRIVAPFGAVLLWSILLAVLLHPFHIRLARRLGNAGSATLIGTSGVALLLAPAVLAGSAIVTSTLALVDTMKTKTIVLGAPPPLLAKVPLLGRQLVRGWSHARTDLPAAISEYGSALKPALFEVATFAGSLAGSIVAFVFALAIAAVLVAHAASLMGIVADVTTRLVGSRARATRQLRLIQTTIRSVAIGVVGVAAIQSAAMGMAFYAIGLPYAGVVLLLVLLICIVQLPALLVAVPAIAWAWYTQEPLAAGLFTGWTLLASLADSPLKTLLLGRGLDVPMPVIFVGVLGGMIAEGLVGLFVGPVLLAILWVLMLEWARGDAAPAPSEKQHG